MKFYSDYGARRTRQIVADVIALALIAGWIWLGVATYHLIARLAGFGQQMEEAGTAFRASMSDVGERLGGIPLIGQGIRVPFDGASSAGGVLESAGRGQQNLVMSLALTLGIGVALLPTLMILVIWLWPRLRFARRAQRARSMVSTGVGIDLLALRALSHQKLATIARIDPDAAGAWRRGDPAVTRKLASLELESSGVRLRS